MRINRILSMRPYRPEEGQQVFGTLVDGTGGILSALQSRAFCAPCHYGVFGGGG
jgi:hypothetical protein